MQTDHRDRIGAFPVAGPDDPTRELPHVVRQFNIPGVSTTDWTVILELSNLSPQVACEALARICGRYWTPIYAFYRRQGHGPEHAEDLTQALFLTLLESSSSKYVHPDRGRFRSFLLGAAKHHQIGELKKLLATKRSGGIAPFTLDTRSEEGCLAFDAEDDSTPEKVYERRWVLALLGHAMESLAGEARKHGDGEVFDRLKGYLTRDDNTAPYAQAAAELGITDGAVKAAVRRLRKGFTTCLRAEVARTLRDPADLEDEISYLFSVFDP